jgi:hypothetical protein
MGTADTASTASGADLLGHVVAHHGVKGMRWGVKKTASTGSGESEGPRSSDSENVQKNIATVKEHGVKALSNKELQDVVTRLNLNQQYSNLTSSKSSIENGHDAVKKVLSIYKTANDVYNAYNSPLAKAIRDGIKASRNARRSASSS